LIIRQTTKTLILTKNKDILMIKHRFNQRENK